MNTTQTKQAKHTAMITLSKGGTAERTVKLETLHIPDCWGIGFEMEKEFPKAGQAVDELWHLAHDLQRHALEQAQINEELLGACLRLKAKAGRMVNADDYKVLCQAIAHATGE